MHKRFLLLIKDNNFHRLHELVKVALENRNFLSYIINKFVDVIDGIYNVNCTQNDKELDFLILQFGGPGLLDIVHRAINLPSVSTAYRMIKG